MISCSMNLVLKDMALLTDFFEISMNKESRAFLFLVWSRSFPMVLTSQHRHSMLSSSSVFISLERQSNMIFSVNIFILNNSPINLQWSETLITSFSFILRIEGNPHLMFPRDLLLSLLNISTFSSINTFFFSSCRRNHNDLQTLFISNQSNLIKCSFMVRSHKSLGERSKRSCLY